MVFGIQWFAFLEGYTGETAMLYLTLPELGFNSELDYECMTMNTAPILSFHCCEKNNNDKVFL